MAASTNSGCPEQKQKASQSKLSSVFTLEKRQKSDSNAGEEVESPKTSPNLPTSIDSKHHKSGFNFRGFKPTTMSMEVAVV